MWKDVLKAACRVCVWYSSYLIRLDKQRTKTALQWSTISISLILGFSIFVSSALHALTLYKKLWFCDDRFSDPKTASGPVSPLLPALTLNHLYGALGCLTHFLTQLCTRHLSFSIPVSGTFWNTISLKAFSRRRIILRFALLVLSSYPLCVSVFT